VGQPVIIHRNTLHFFVYLAVLLCLTVMMLGMPWSSAYLSAIIIFTYLAFRPKYIFHPNNMVFAYYGLYVVLSSTLNLILSLINWSYVLPWGQMVNWREMSPYLFAQTEFTFLVLFFGFRYFCRSASHMVNPRSLEININRNVTAVLYVLCVFLVLIFMHLTAGINEWFNNYSFTYLTKREGYGLLNVSIIAIGNITIYLLGLKTLKANRKWPIIGQALLLCAILSLTGGIKSRFIFLLIVYMSPLFLRMPFRLKTIFIFAASFFVLLYIGTLFRTEFFYASPAYFLEMLIDYFNAYQLHDYILTSRAPGLFETIWQVFVKPLQILGLMSQDANFDISVMLTKEFFPEQWENEHATQQWPLETELYLNYFGIYFSWIPLLFYTATLGWLYRLAILGRNYYILLIYIMEFMRIFSALRGTLIPWEMPIYVAQYIIIYFVCIYSIRVKILDNQITHQKNISLNTSPI
jgi:hypothetical protein